MHIQELARRLEGQIDPTLDVEISGVATIADATPQDVTFLANPKYISQLRQCQAGAVLVAQDFELSVAVPLLRVAHPYLAFAQAIELFYTKPQPARQVHPTVVLGQGVSLGENVAIGAYVVVGDNVRIGHNVTIHSHCAIYDAAEIGDDCVLHSHAVVRESVKLGNRVILQNGAVIGADGFGFVPLADGSFSKILQAGTTVLEDDVEIQVHTAVDRATIGETRIGQGTKVDNLVQVGHGCKVGQHTLLCGQVGLAGSTEVGNHVILAGQVGASGHLKIGDRAIAAARATVLDSVPAGQQVCGYPAIEHRQWRRISTALKHLPQMLHRLRRLERILGEPAPDSAEGKAES